MNFTLWFRQQASFPLGNVCDGPCHLCDVSLRPSFKNEGLITPALGVLPAASTPLSTPLETALNEESHLVQEHTPLPEQSTSIDLLTWGLKSPDPATKLSGALRSHPIFRIPQRITWGFHWDSIATSHPAKPRFFSFLLGCSSQEHALINPLNANLWNGFSSNPICDSLWNLNIN